MGDGAVNWNLSGAAKTGFFYDKKIWAVAKSTSNADVLYVTKLEDELQNDKSFRGR